MERGKKGTRPRPQPACGRARTGANVTAAGEAAAVGSLAGTHRHDARARVLAAAHLLPRTTRLTRLPLASCALPFGTWLSSASSSTSTAEG